ncbi:MAG: hypothetical protein WC878_04200 [Candidatus Paceibacterota bacterium]|jgi:hypothetical protein
MIHAFFKNVALLFVGEGCLLLPLAWCVISVMYFSLPLITVAFGMALFILHIPAIQSFRKHVLGIHDVCSPKGG